MRGLRAVGIGLLHLPPVTLLFIGTTATDWLAFGVFYVLVLFALGAGLHRYFAHGAFTASRPMQLVLAALAGAFFADPIRFAGSHRLHHRWADTPRDFHGPARGWWFSWIGHHLEDGYSDSELLAAARDLAQRPELVWLHRYSYVSGTGAAALTWLLGGYGVFAAGYCLAWCLVGIHGGSAVNYFCHKSGRRRFETPDRSTNNTFLGFVLFGEGWHNNHHRFPGAARAGVRWYELDLLFYMLRVLTRVGLISSLRDIPETHAAGESRGQGEASQGKSDRGESSGRGSHGWGAVEAQVKPWLKSGAMKAGSKTYGGPPTI